MSTDSSSSDDSSDEQMGDASPAQSADSPQHSDDSSHHSEDHRIPVADQHNGESPADSPAQGATSDEDMRSHADEPMNAERSDSDEDDKKSTENKSSGSDGDDDDDDDDDVQHKKRTAQFKVGYSDEESHSPPSERQPEPERKVSESGSEKSHAEEEGKEDDEGATRADLGDLDISDSNDEHDDDDDDDEQKKDLTEDEIVGPRLYPDPDAAPDDDEDHVEPTIVEVNTARICPNFKDEGIYFVKFPNFLSVDPRPFDQEHYEDEFDEEEVMDEEGRARLKLRVENTIRWRYALDDDGNIIKQSNAKIVKWTDGTMSLYLGSEVFDVQAQPMQQDNHLFMRQGAGLQGHAVFKEKLVFRPYTTDSITHRKMTLSMADRSNKMQKVKVISSVGIDPESQKAEIVRKEEERLRAQNRREAMQRRMRRPAMRQAGLSGSFLEGREDDSDAEESISAIKNSYKNPYGHEHLLGHSDSEDSDSRRLHDAKRDSDASDSEERMKHKKKKVIIEDDEEEG